MNIVTVRSDATPGSTGDCGMFMTWLLKNVDYTVRTPGTPDRYKITSTYTGGKKEKDSQVWKS